MVHSLMKQKNKKKKKKSEWTKTWIDHPLKQYSSHMMYLVHSMPIF